MHLHLGQAYCIQSLCDDGVPIGDSGIIVQWHLCHHQPDDESFH